MLLARTGERRVTRQRTRSADPRAAEPSQCSSDVGPRFMTIVPLVEFVKCRSPRCRRLFEHVKRGLNVGDRVVISTAARAAPVTGRRCESLRRRLSAVPGAGARRPRFGPLAVSSGQVHLGRGRDPKSSRRTRCARRRGRGADSSRCASVHGAAQDAVAVRRVPGTPRARLTCTHPGERGARSPSGPVVAIARVVVTRPRAPRGAERHPVSSDATRSLRLMNRDGCPALDTRNRWRACTVDNASQLVRNSRGHSLHFSGVARRRNVQGYPVSRVIPSDVRPSVGLEGGDPAGGLGDLGGLQGGLVEVAVLLPTTPGRRRGGCGSGRSTRRCGRGPRGRRPRWRCGSSWSSRRCRARCRSRRAGGPSACPTNGTSQTIRGVAKPGR